MCERIYAEIEFLGHPHGCSDLALYIGVTGNETLFIHDLNQCIQLQVSDEQEPQQQLGQRLSFW